MLTNDSTTFKDILSLFHYFVNTCINNDSVKMFTKFNNFANNRLKSQIKSLLFKILRHFNGKYIIRVYLESSASAQYLDKTTAPLHFCVSTISLSLFKKVAIIEK